MPDLAFAVIGAEAVTDAAAPEIAFRMHVSDASGEPIRSISLRCQVRIESPRRRYAEAERARLVDLFGETSRWGQTLRDLLWTNAAATVGPFEGETAAVLPVACTYDFNVAVTKYFDAIEDGEVPLLFLFSGTVFYANPEGVLQIEQIPWSSECSFRLPVRVWKDMMERYYPNTAWLCVRKDVFDRLHEYKMRRGIPTWEQTLESILP
ncbi:MAG TPA: DUF6084 family protein [Bryobacteraceae bacterium]|jgi:hypothetical protein|nr:DUF6084 family protein [Bryobacteraceae bacterium]